MSNSPILGAARHGAYLGLKWATLIIGSVIVIVLVIIAVGTIYAIVFLDRAHMFDEPEFRSAYLKIIAASIGAYVSSAVWSAIIGAIVAVCVQLIRGKQSS